MLLVIVQSAIMRWGLAPLNKITEELAAIKTGRQTRLEFNYPGELTGLTDNVNALLSHQQEHLERYRHTLADLAHSLKTPLAVLRAAVEEDEKGGTLRTTVQAQIDRMTQITDHQLGRAAAAGQSPLVAPVAIRDIVKKIVGSLRKVYAEKGVECRIEIPKDAVFHGDEGDLMEIIGNITDNAFKWCKTRVRITGHLRKNLELEKETLEIIVEDDGPGVSPAMVKNVVERGVRADQAISGHGIGLSVVQDIVTIYGGQLQIGASKLGGAAIGFILPDLS
jgi:two-component system sensor histidine kinase PhoQ